MRSLIAVTIILVAMLATLVVIGLRAGDRHADDINGPEDAS